MSESGRKDLGYPQSEITHRRFILERWCNSYGAGGCPSVLGVTQFVYYIRVSKYLTFNRSLLLNNPEEKGIAIYSDAGASGGCAHSNNILQPWWLGFSTTGSLTDAQVKAQDIEITDPAPLDIDVAWSKLPQPTDAGWNNKIYVHIVWDSASYIQLAPMYDGILKVVKHNRDLEV